MPVWLIEPRDPLIARDGRPIGGDAPIDTLAFPYPSTIAGAARTRMASAGGAFSLRSDEVRKALWRIPVAGPLLAEVDPGSGAVREWLLPAPRDAILRAAAAAALPGSGGPVASIAPLVPGAIPHGCCVDGLEEHRLLPLLARGTPGAKPLGEAPAFWRWDAYARWLAAPAPRDAVRPGELGIGPLPRETRAHVALAMGERVSDEGDLFQTTGLRFVQASGAGRDAQARLRDARHFALSLRCDERSVSGQTLALRDELAPLGGERRLAFYRPAGTAWPALPEAVRAQVVATRRARVLLVTPAAFGFGALPAWSGREWPLGGPVRARVRAACVPSAEVISGWSLHKQRPKPTRRLAPAGSVYFVALEGGAEQDVDAWLTGAWLQGVSDAKKDRLDGFGLAAIGVWTEGAYPA